SAGERISETTGEAVEVTYLIQASPAEKIMRDKIASDFLHDQIERMMKDPEAFNKRSVRDDFILYLNKNPEQLKALHITMSHPDVERQEHRIDIPAWQTATEIIVGFIPFVGQGVAIAELISGRDLFGHPLTTTERVILGVAIVLPGIAKVVKGGKAAFTASRIVKEYGLHGDEAARVYKIYMGLAPGTAGAKLFDWGAKQIKKGRAIDDPKVLQEMETVLKELGMTDKETAKALMPVAVKEQMETVAKEEVQALKAMAGPVTVETEEMLLKNAPLREALKENTLAAKVLKKCNTPCWPEEATAAQVERLEHLIERLKKADAFDEEFLRGFLYRRRKNLDKAIDAVADKAVAAETAQAAKQAKAAAKQAKQEAKIMDVAERNKAAADLERAEAKIAERKKDITTASQEGRQARKDLAALMAQSKPVPSNLRSEMARIEKLKTVEQKLEALDKLKPGSLSQAEREFLAWRRQTWELQQEAEASEEAAKFLGEGFETLVTQKEVAAQALRESSQDVMAVLRTEGPNYRARSSISIDQVMTKASWEALTTKPALATDHLVALDRISKLSQLNELLVLYTKASKSVKAEIKQALKGLGDMDKNLVRMRSDVNSGLKSNKSWHDITYAQVEGKYTVGEVDAIRIKEDESLAQILQKIDELTAAFREKVAGKPATKAAGAGAK
ncbi:MAG TPA: pre-toxin TG domain-containing protein, partial [Pyrinomonadaceae bacterium]|nr:pre-toxin TG domain-containing protein [Pyrinomonadaceae bacterium]